MSCYCYCARPICPHPRPAVQIHVVSAVHQPSPTSLYSIHASARGRYDTFIKTGELHAPSSSQRKPGVAPSDARDLSV